MDRLGDAGRQMTMRRRRRRSYQRTTGLGCRRPYRRSGGRRGRWCGTLEPPACIALLRGGAVAPPYATAARLKTLSAAPPSAAAALLDPLDAAPYRGGRSAVLRCCGPFVRARHWSGKAQCGHSGRCRRLPQGKSRCGASRCGRNGRSRRGGWLGAKVYWAWGS
jgi:hypothetical protein